MGAEDRGGAAFPVWRCSAGHVNDPLRGSCRDCGESRPCQRCQRKPARLYPNGMWCDRCGVVAPDQFEAQTFEAPDAQVSVPKPVLVAQRGVQGDEYAGSLKSLMVWCEKQEIACDVQTAEINGSRVAVLLADVEPGNRVFVVWQEKASEKQVGIGTTYLKRRAFTFVKSLGSTIPGKGTLRDAKRALGMDVAEPTPRAPRATASVSKPAGRADTMR